MDKSKVWSFNESDLTPVEKTLYTLEVGDVIVNEFDTEKIVLEVLTQSCLLNDWSGNKDAGDWRTFVALEEDGFKVKQTQPTPLKMTQKAFNQYVNDCIIEAAKHGVVIEDSDNLENLMRYEPRV